MSSLTEKMKYYPIYLNLRKRKCVVVGGGRTAERKIRQLLKAGAAVTVISPDLTTGLKRLLAAEKIRHVKREYRKGDAGNAFLVIAATSDARVNKVISEGYRGLVNAVDMPEYCSFIMPSVITRGPLTIAISTSGVSPALARTMREDLENHLPDELAGYLAYLKSVREKVMAAMPGTSGDGAAKRSRLLKEVGSIRMLELLREKGLESVREHIDAMLREKLKKRGKERPAKKPEALK
jgi:precorrin-2 dehydrogenase/sirohydrochlorin ferrochelatase